MSALQDAPRIQNVIQEIDRLIADLTALRSQVAALASPPVPPSHSVREAEYFGMWADREDMHGRSSREWLEDLRDQQWKRP